MTNSEWLNELVPEVSQGIKTAVMTARGVTPEAEFSYDESIELTEADLYMRMQHVKSFSEGSLSIQYDLSSLKAEAQRIYKKYGDARYSSGQPLIRAIKLP